MPSDPNQLPDDDESSPEVGYLEEDDSHDPEVSDSDEKAEFDPVGVTVEQLKFLDDNMTLGENDECDQQVLDLYNAFESGPLAAFEATLQTRTFYKSMFSRVTDRVTAAATAVPPTVSPTEQEDDRGEEQEEDEDEGEEEHVPLTEGSMSEAGTVPPRSETPTQP